MLSSLALRPAAVESLWKLPFLASLVLPIFIFVLTAMWTAKVRLEVATVKNNRLV
jgi:hypothetical protein